VLTIAIDENGLIRVVGAEANKSSATVKLEPKVYEHINLADEHIKVLAEAELKM